MADLGTYAENTWCPGCGNFAILNAFKKAVTLLEEKGIGKDKILISAGIGCHAKIYDYLNLSGLYSIHGRSMATVEGIKFANPDLKVVAFTGDGDAFGEGISHLLFAAKRNADITVMIHDNGAYSLTTGQFSPLSKKGFKSPSTPRGNIEDPLNPLVMLLEAGATFVARGYSTKLKNLVDIMVKGIEHKGFSFIDILQPCVTYNNTYKEYNKRVEILEKTPENFEEAVKLAKMKDKLSLGIFYQTQKPPYHELLYGDYNPIGNHPTRDDRLIRIIKLIQLIEK